MEVVDKADVIGSTGKIIREVEAGPAGHEWAIGTELHLVNRLKHEHPEQEIHFLSPVVCMCATMYRIDLAHLCWSAGEPGGRHAGERDRGRRRDGPLGAGGAGADAGGEMTSVGTATRSSVGPSPEPLVAPLAAMPCRLQRWLR